MLPSTPSTAISGIFLALAILLTPAWVSAGPRAKRGQQKYTRYCAACHGPSGKGDGILAEALKIPPPDLTKLAERNGRFDGTKVAEYIDGRRSVRAHGPTQMPVWGTRFASETPKRKDSEAHVDRNIDALVAYLKSIQAKKGSGTP